MRWVFPILAFLTVAARAETPSFLASPPKPPVVGRLPPAFGYRGDGDYAFPTEHNPREAVPVVKNAPRGVYVSVGFDRSFIGAAVTAGADHLLVVDRSGLIIEMANYNAGLLALAHDRADYLKLRLSATHEEIVERAKESKMPADYLGPLRDSALAWEFQNKVRPNPRREAFDVLNQPPQPDLGEVEYGYKDANYLYDDVLFAKLQTMAREGRISGRKVDLANFGQVSKIVNELEAKQLGLCVLDVSDTWFHSPNQFFSFLLPEQSLLMWRTFGRIGKPESVLLMTSWDNRQTRRRDPRGKNLEFWPWIYFGLSYKTVMHPTKAGDTLDAMLAYYDRLGGGSVAWHGQLDPDLTAAGSCGFKRLAPEHDHF